MICKVTTSFAKSAHSAVNLVHSLVLLTCFSYFCKNITKKETHETKNTETTGCGNDGAAARQLRTTGQAYRHGCRDQRQHQRGAQRQYRHRRPHHQHLQRRVRHLSAEQRPGSEGVRPQVSHSRLPVLAASRRLDCRTAHGRNHRSRQRPLDSWAGLGQADHAHRLHQSEGTARGIHHRH